jgi:hypothetical protein
MSDETPTEARTTSMATTASFLIFFSFLFFSPFLMITRAARLFETDERHVQSAPTRCEVHRRRSRDCRGSEFQAHSLLIHKPRAYVLDQTERAKQ